MPSTLVLTKEIQFRSKPLGWLYNKEKDYILLVLIQGSSSGYINISAKEPQAIASRTASTFYLFERIQEVCRDLASLKKIPTVVNNIIKYANGKHKDALIKMVAVNQSNLEDFSTIHLLSEIPAGYLRTVLISPVSTVQKFIGISSFAIPEDCQLKAPLNIQQLNKLLDSSLPQNQKQNGESYPNVMRTLGPIPNEVLIPQQVSSTNNMTIIKKPIDIVQKVEELNDIIFKQQAQIDQQRQILNNMLVKQQAQFNQHLQAHWQLQSQLQQTKEENEVIKRQLEQQAAEIAQLKQEKNQVQTMDNTQSSRSHKRQKNVTGKDENLNPTELNLLSKKLDTRAFNDENGHISFFENGTLPPSSCLPSDFFKLDDEDSILNFLNLPALSSL